MHANEAWYHNPAYWVALGFIIFIAVFVRYVLPMILQALDSRADAIRGQLEQASKLRAEAEEVLESFKKKQAEMEIEAARIIEEAKEEAERMRNKAKEELAQMIMRRNEQAEAKIAMMEKEARAEIRTKMVEIATNAAEQLIREKLAKDGTAKTMRRAIQSLEEKLH